MLRVSFQRAAMAILLVGMMIAPLGICLQQGPKAAHSCCMQTESAHSLQTNCCVVRAHLPAILTAPTLPGTGPSATVYEYPACEEATVSVEHRAVEVTPPLSPPTGAFILRI